MTEEREETIPGRVIMNKNNTMEKNITDSLFQLQDRKYRSFHSALIPTVDSETVIGVRIPELRKLAAKLAKDPDIGDFLSKLPHHYYEENNLHGFIIETEKDFEKCMEQIEAFLPYVDNWATCDAIVPKVFKNNLTQLLEKIKEWVRSERTYTIRFGMKMLMTFYLDDCFDREYLEIAAAVESEEYYVKMMKAWFFATALAKQYDATLPYIEERRFDEWTHNKTIQKAVESYRVTDEHKIYLKSLKIKKEKSV